MVACGLLIGAPSLTAVPGYALGFDGVDDYVETSTGVIPSSGDFTVEFWAACPTAPGSFREILSQGSSGNALYIGTDPSNYLRLGDGWGAVSPLVPFPVGGWHHFAVVKSSTNTIFYLDGTNRLARGSAMPNPAVSTGLRLGRQYGSYGEYWPGSVGDVRIWSRALSAAEVSDSRSNSLTGAETGLLAAWKVLEGAGTNCTSIGATNVVGRLLNGPLWLNPDSNYALSLNGANQYVNTTIPGLAGNYTLSAWVYLRSGGDSPVKRVGVITGTDCGGSVEMMVQSGTASASDPQYMELGRCGAFSGTLSTNPVPLNQWVHLAVTVDAAKQVAYFINGAPAGTWNASSQNLSLGPNLHLGDNLVRKFNGLLDGVQIWSRALTQAEIQAGMGRAVNTEDANLVAYWSFNDLTAVASGGTNSIGYLINGPTWTNLGPSLPLAITGEATDVSYTVATLGGTVNPGNLTTLAWFEWGTSTDYGQVGTAVQVASTNASAAVSIALNNLTPAQTYHYRLVASNSVGQATGSDRTFQTATPVLPVVSTGEATEISPVSATLGGMVNVRNLPTAAWFEWGSTTNYGRITAITNLAAIDADLVVSSALTNLAGGQTYHYRLVASNIVGQIAGSDREFQTPDFALLTGLDGIGGGSVAWGDYDNDGRLDVLLAGYGSSSDFSRVYHNNGDGTFSWNTGAVLPSVTSSSVAWGDYDSDGWLDILLSGQGDSSRITQVYHNNRDGTFSWNTDAVLAGATEASAAWGDYNNDGWLDILVAGLGNSEHVSKIYRNNGDGTFTDINAGLPGVRMAAAAWGDYDNDGRLDVLLTGRSTSMVGLSRVYHNNGDGTFSWNTNAVLQGVMNSSVAWGDYDNDGRLDILLSGQIDSNYTSRIYRNNGDGTFTDLNAGLPGVRLGGVAWGDYDNDGWLDFLLTGEAQNSVYISRIYRNNADGTFTSLSMTLPGVFGSSVAWGDCDNDGRLDFLLAGCLEVGVKRIASVYHNFSLATNTPPSAPAGLSSTVSVDRVTLSWNAASDTATPQAGLSYNVRVGSTPGASDILQSDSNLTNGLRRLAQRGNAQHNTSISLQLSRPPASVCYWSVQAVDTSWAASPFAAEGSFTNMDTYHVPVVATEPVDIVAFSGTAAQLEARVTGVPRNCYWYRNGNVSVPGGTNEILSWNNLSAADAGSYWLVVSNGLGMVTSRVASVTVWTSPVSQAVPSGSPVNLAVTPPGTGSFAFRWQRDGTNLPTQIIRTVAGNGSASFGADGDLAVNAGLSNVQGITLDAAGNLYLSDAGNHRVYKVGLDGRIQKVAGTGIPDLGPDGQLATLSPLYEPKGVTVDAAGNLFIADSGNDRVCKVGLNGLLTTVAGNGYETLDGILATEAYLPSPEFLSLDGATNLFVTVIGDQRVRKVTPDGLIWTVAGTKDFDPFGDPGWATNTPIARPYGICMNNDGDFFVSDREASDDKALPVLADLLHGVARNGKIRTVAGEGTNYWSESIVATNARLTTVGGLALDASGNLYLSESYLARIRRIGTNGIIQTIAGNGTAGFSGDWGAALQASLSNPAGLACDRDGNLFFSDAGNSRIRQVVNTDRARLTFASAGSADVGSYRLVVSNITSGLSFTSAVVNVTLADPPQIVSHPVNSTNCAGMTATFSVSVKGTSLLSYRWYRQESGPVSGGIGPVLTLANLVDEQAGVYFVVVTNTYGAATSSLARLTMVAPPRFLTQPQNLNLAAGASGVLTASVTGAGPFDYQWQHDGTNLPHGIISTLTNLPVEMPVGMALDSSGNLFVADGMGNRVYKYTPGGLVSVVAGTGVAGFSGDKGPATSARLTMPYWVAFDPAGNLFISDTGTNRVRKVDTNGIITTMAGMGIGAFFGDGNQATNALLSGPAGLAFNAAGDLFIGDAFNNRIRMITPGGIITTVAGNGDALYAGDGGLAVLASLSTPIQALPDSTGNLYVADMRNHCVRKINSSGIITTFAGSHLAAFAGDCGMATNAALNSPSGLAFDKAGNLYIADMQNNRVRRVDTDGVIATVAGNGNSGKTGDGGLARNAAVGAPVSVLMDREGGMFIASQQGVRKVTSLAGPVLTLNNASSNTWGSYRLVVTSLTSGASITSSVVVVNQAQLRILTDASLGIAANRFGFNMTSPTNRLVVVEASTNLGAPIWVPLQTNTVGETPVYFSEPGWSQHPRRFYRLRSLGTP